MWHSSSNEAIDYFDYFPNEVLEALTKEDKNWADSPRLNSPRFDLPNCISGLRFGRCSGNLRDGNKRQ